MAPSAASAMATATIAASNDETPAETRRNSSPPEPATTCRDKVPHPADLRFQAAAARRCDLLGSAAVVSLEGHDHALRLEASDCAIQGARSQPSAGDGLDVVDHRVAMLGS